MTDFVFHSTESIILNPGNAAIDTPRTDSSVKPKGFQIPLGGVTNPSHQTQDTTQQADSIRVMPGPGWNPDPSQNTFPRPVSEGQPTISGSADSLHRRWDPFRNSNALLLPNQSWDLKAYAQVYSQDAYFDKLGVTKKQSLRSSYFSGILQATIGIGNQLNLGLDAWYQAAHFDTLFGSPLKVLRFENNPTAHAALTRLGPRVRFRLSARNGLLFQSSMLFPVAKDPDGSSSNRPGISSKQVISWSQVFTNLQLGPRSTLYLEGNLYWNISLKPNLGHVALPLTTYYSYFPHRKIALQAMTQIWPYLGRNLISSGWIQSGIGARWAVTDRISLEGLFSRFWLGAYSAGPAQTFNIGIRYLKW